MNIRLLITFAALLVIVTPGRLGAEEPKKAKNPPRIDVTVDRARSLLTRGGDFDDKQDVVQLKITIRNKEMNKDVKGLTARVWIFGRSAVDRRVYQVLQVEKFPIELTAEPAGRELIHQTKEIRLRFDTTGAAFGVSYQGWLLLVTNEANEVVTTKSTSSVYESMLERATALEKDEWIDLNLRSTAGPDE